MLEMRRRSVTVINLSGAASPNFKEMIDMTDPTAGQDGGAKLVRRALFFTLFLSLAANVGHTLLAVSVIPAWLRMIGAVAWPLLIFLGVDITVKVAWEIISGRRLGVWCARLLILIPAIPAGIASYEHMHAVLLAMGERPFIAQIGPGAVDLFMIGCTITLVLLSKPIAAQPEPAPQAVVAELPEIPELEPAPEATENEQKAADLLSLTLTNPRKPRAAKVEQEKAVRMMLDGQATEAVDAGLMGASTMRRYVKVQRMLIAGQIEVDPIREKVNPELVEIIRTSLKDGAA